MCGVQESHLHHIVLFLKNTKMTWLCFSRFDWRGCQCLINQSRVSMLKMKKNTSWWSSCTPAVPHLCTRVLSTKFWGSRANLWAPKLFRPNRLFPSFLLWALSCWFSTEEGPLLWAWTCFVWWWSAGCPGYLRWLHTGSLWTWSIKPFPYGLLVKPEGDCVLDLSRTVQWCVQRPVFLCSDSLTELGFFKQ